MQCTQIIILPSTKKTFLLFVDLYFENLPRAYPYDNSRTFNETWYIMIW